MNLKTLSSNKIQYGIVGNLLTMNHFLIMVLHKKANFLCHIVLFDVDV
jgi:hypothetical protein